MSVLAGILAAIVMVPAVSGPMIDPSKQIANLKSKTMKVRYRAELEERAAARAAAIAAREAEEAAQTEATHDGAPSATAPPASSYGSGEVQQIIIDAAHEFGLDPGYLLSVADCESGFNPRAYNPDGPYMGLFQYSSTTWANNGYGSIWDPVAQSRTTARMLSQGGASHWPNCA